MRRRDLITIGRLVDADVSRRRLRLLRQPNVKIALAVPAGTRRLEGLLALRYAEGEEAVIWRRRNEPACRAVASARTWLARGPDPGYLLCFGRPWFAGGLRGKSVQPRRSRARSR